MKGGSGIALMESSNISVHENTVSGAKIGIRLSLGSSDNEVYDNVIDNTTYGELHKCSVRANLLVHWTACPENGAKMCDPKHRTYVGERGLEPARVVLDFTFLAWFQTYILRVMVGQYLLGICSKRTAEYWHGTELLVLCS